MQGRVMWARLPCRVSFRAGSAHSLPLCHPATWADFPASSSPPSSPSPVRPSRPPLAGLKGRGKGFVGASSVLDLLSGQQRLASVLDWEGLESFERCFQLFNSTFVASKNGLVDAFAHTDSVLAFNNDASLVQTPPWLFL